MTKKNLHERLASLKPTKPVHLSKMQGRKRDRESERRSAYKFGTLRLAGGEEIKCIVQDLSATGMKIKLQGAQALTPEMFMVISGMGFSRPVRLCWQNEDEAGLSY